MGQPTLTSRNLLGGSSNARVVKWSWTFFVLLLPSVINFGLKAQENSELNSDQITQKFGSYGVEVLAQTPAMRVANLYSKHDGEKICRTLAVTRFNEPTPPALKEADSLIRSGESIGLTLRSQGWAIEKNVAAQCSIPPGPAFQALAGNAQFRDVLSVRVYTLTANDGEQHTDYAAIAEAYHPDHIILETAEPCAEGIWQRLSPLEIEALRSLQQWVASIPQVENRATSDRSNPRA